MTLLTVCPNWRNSTIRTLETNLFGQKLAPFKNVDYLITNEVRAIHKDTLGHLPKLKELYYNQAIEQLFQELYRRFRRESPNELYDELITVDRVKDMNDFWFASSSMKQRIEVN